MGIPEAIGPTTIEVEQDWIQVGKKAKKEWQSQSQMRTSPYLTGLGYWKVIRVLTRIKKVVRTLIQNMTMLEF